MGSGKGTWTNEGNKKRGRGRKGPRSERTEKNCLKKWAKSRNGVDREEFKNERKKLEELRKQKKEDKESKNRHGREYYETDGVLASNWGI